MGFAHYLLLTATPPPGGDLREGLSPDQVGPGLAGFIATFAVVAVTILLIVDMARRVRRVRYSNRQDAASTSPAEEASAGSFRTSAREQDKEAGASSTWTEADDDAGSSGRRSPEVSDDQDSRRG